MQCAHWRFVWKSMVMSVILKSHEVGTYPPDQEFKLNDMVENFKEGLVNLQKHNPNISIKDFDRERENFVMRHGYDSSSNSFVDISTIGVENVQLLKPTGFNISIKAVPHVRQILFHARLNERFANEDEGTIYPINPGGMDMHLRIDNGENQTYYEYANFTTVLNMNDTMFYWINAVYQNATDFIRILCCERSLTIFYDGTFFRTGHAIPEVKRITFE